MRTLIANTEDYIKLAKTQLSASAAPGSNVNLTVQDNNGINQNAYVVIGREGAETCEIQKVSASVTLGTTIQVGSLLFAHGVDEPITIFRYNARKFYGAISETGAYTELTAYGSPVTISVDNPQGTLLEYTGTEGYKYFKSTYFNTTTSEESDISDSIAVLADESKRYCSIYAIRVQSGLTNNPFITDGMIETYRKRAENEVDSYLNAKYILPLVNSTGAVEIPFMVENVTTLLAAGYMDYKEFGKDGEGVKWLGEARSILKQLQSPGGQQLLGSDRLEMATRQLASGVQSWPNDVDNNNGPTRMFSTSQRF